MNTASSDIPPSVEELRRPEFWRQHFPSLSICERLASCDSDAASPDTIQLQLCRARMAEEGYFQERNTVCERFAPVLAEAVIKCKRLDLPPVFIFMFDEVWECFYALHPYIAILLGDDYRIQPEAWAWHVDPGAGETGFAPHRDRGRVSLAADSSVLSLTVWIALNEALPMNGCIYVLPANRDPVYGTERDEQGSVDLMQVRALPAAPGDFLFWSQALLHWGAATSRFASHPRISMGLDYQRRNAPFASTDRQIEPFSQLDFNQRLRFVAEQIPRYQRPENPRFSQLSGQLLA